MQAPNLPILARNIESWFLREQRPLPWRRGYDPWLVWVSEVMLQQTRMDVVLPYFERFVRRFPTLQSLASAEEAEALAAWSGLGYYRRARMLREGAIDVTVRFGGEIPADPAALQTIAGIGRYTAGAIASIAFGRKAPIVDGNVARIVSRIFAIDEPAGSPALMREAWVREAALVAACSDPRSFNQGLMEIGALICTPRKPDCGRCPLSAGCAAHATGRTSSLPLPKKPAPVRALNIALYLIRDRRGRILMRREHGRLMDGMYHLPHGDNALLPAAPLSVTRKSLAGSFRHTVTDRRIEFSVWHATLRGHIAERDGEYEWVEPPALADLPHPSYVRKALAKADVRG